MPDTSRKILERQIADALAVSHKLCIASSMALYRADTHVDQSHEAITRSRALLARVVEGERIQPRKGAGDMNSADEPSLGVTGSG
jgi:hypothetical protein